MLSGEISIHVDYLFKNLCWSKSIYKPELDRVSHSLLFVIMFSDAPQQQIWYRSGWLDQCSSFLYPSSYFSPDLFYLNYSCSMSLNLGVAVGLYLLDIDEIDRRKVEFCI